MINQVANGQVAQPSAAAVVNHPSTWFTRVKIERFALRVFAFLAEAGGYAIAGAVFAEAMPWYAIFGILVTAMMSVELKSRANNMVDGADQNELQKLRENLQVQTYDEIRKTYHLETILTHRLLTSNTLQQKVYLSILNNPVNFQVKGDAGKLFENQIIDLPLLEAIKINDQGQMRQLSINGLRPV